MGRSHCRDAGLSRNCGRGDAENDVARVLQPRVVYRLDAHVFGFVKDNSLHSACSIIEFRKEDWEELLRRGRLFVELLTCLVGEIGSMAKGKAPRSTHALAPDKGLSVRITRKQPVGQLKASREIGRQGLRQNQGTSLKVIVSSGRPFRVAATTACRTRSTHRKESIPALMENHANSFFWPPLIRRICDPVRIRPGQTVVTRMPSSQFSANGIGETGQCELTQQ